MRVRLVSNQFPVLYKKKTFVAKGFLKEKLTLL